MLIALSALIIGPWSVGPVLTVSNSTSRPLAFFSVCLVGMGDRWRRVWREESIIAFYCRGRVMYLLTPGRHRRFSAGRLRPHMPG